MVPDIPAKVMPEQKFFTGGQGFEALTHAVE
jgi:hypothetical protein